MSLWILYHLRREMRYPPFLSVNQIFGSPPAPFSISFSFSFLFFIHVPWRPCPGAAAARFPVEGPARLDHQFGLGRTSSDCAAMLTPVDASASRLFPSQLTSAQRCSDVIRA
ncbi:hypothetical protein HZ326_8240 [Fusarium oxysporum f. sp. albedinis]|nr:hypothetical protein HZ326_8240 [Fusarium oxysporum f. sp. albedinis]